jgi:hypothetical protein
MRTEEQRLTDWLHEVTPEPPREIDPATIAARVSRRAPRRWLPALAAACVVALVAGLVLALRSGGKHTPPSRPSPTLGKTHSAPSSRVPSSGAAPPPRPIGLWHGVPLGNTRVQAGTLAAIGGQLYGVAQNDFVRLDARTGAVLARSAVVREVEGFGPPAAAGGLIWFQGKTPEQLLGLDPLTLAQRATVTLAGLRGAGDSYPAVLAPGPDDDTLLVAGHDRVAFVDATHARVERHLDVAGEVTGVSLSPDGSRLYVANTPRLSVDGVVRMLDPNTGAVLDSGESNPALGLQATAGGVWFTSAGGHEAQIEFQPAGNSSPPPISGAGVSGGGDDVLPTISGGVAWLGGYGSAGCADPVTGKLRARTTRSVHRPEYLNSITVAAGHVYALYGVGDRSRLVTLRPPAACGIK